MPWYKSGLVSVTQNSNAVIGTSTAFIANSRVGDAFRGPDGAWYEVTNIASDTALSISPSYQGATNGAGVYALAPLQGYVKDSADALRALVNTYGSKLAALGTTGNYDVLPTGKGGTGITDLSSFIQLLLNDGDAAAARLTLVAAKSGANSDITGLSALTTALSVTQGGTGGNTPALARSGLGLGSAAVAAILGAVSQSGGTPTGALMEYVSNSAGEAWKFACGLVIMITTGVRSIVVGTAVGTASAMYYPGAPSSGSNRPVSVVGTAFDWLTIDGGAGLNFAVPVGSPPTGTYRQFYHLSLTPNTAQNYTYSYLSIGRWF